MKSDDDKTELALFDHDTWKRLTRLSKITGTPRAQLVAALIRDILLEDETAHALDHVYH